MEQGDSLKLDVFRPRRQGIRKVLGDLEADVMESVWLHSEGNTVSVRDVFEHMQSARKIAYTTVMSTMARLARKGLLQVDTAEQSYRYRPRFTEDALSREIVQSVIAGLMMNFEGETLSYLDTLRAGETEPNTVRRELRGEIQRRREAREP